MKKLLTLLLLFVGIAGCSLLVFRPRQAFDQLREAQKPEEEAAVFRHIWKNADELNFSAYDPDGETIPVSNPDFPARLHAIDLQVNGKSYRHVLIEPENVFILMRE